MDVHSTCSNSFSSRQAVKLTGRISRPHPNGAYDSSPTVPASTNADVEAPPYIRFEDNLRWWQLGATIPVEAEQDWRLGLSAVLEEKDGTKSYWALAHPPGAPDFHHPDCFAAQLP